MMSTMIGTRMTKTIATTATATATGMPIVTIIMTTGFANTDRSV